MDAGSGEWKESVQLVFEYFCERTPRSFVEQRGTSLVWNYKYAGGWCPGFADCFDVLFSAAPLWHHGSAGHGCLFSPSHSFPTCWSSEIRSLEFGCIQARDFLPPLTFIKRSHSPPDFFLHFRCAVWAHPGLWLPPLTFNTTPISLFLFCNADVEFGRIQARDLLQHLLTGPISNAPVDIVRVRLHCVGGIWV